LVERVGIPAVKIAVTPLAADDGMVSQSSDAINLAMERLGIRAPYLITVGRIEKKKGIVEIVEALSQLPDGIDLVLIGRDGYGADEVRRRVVELGLTSRVHFLGWVEINDLPALLSGAIVYVSACRYEGFSIAVLDALACGCPVVAYRAGAVSETVGEAAVLVDPSGSDSLVTGIHMLLESQSERERLSKLGLTRAAEFNWKRTAEQTWSCLTNT
jgi:alpha-1,3-rhamnosyl/mannosyltransferase